MPTYKRAATNLEEALKKAKRTPTPSVKAPVADIGAAALSPSGVLQLQRLAGNRATTQLLETGSGQVSTIQRSANDLIEDEDLPCPGSKINSQGLGQGKGYGQGKGPVGAPVGDKKDEWL